MTAVETETEPNVETQAANKVNDLLIEYTNLRNAHAAGTISADDFDKQSRTLRRKIRNAGGSVRELKTEADDAPSAEKPAKAAKEPRAKKEKKRSRVEAGLDGDPKAQPAGKGHVEWLERVLSGQQDLPDGPQPHIELEQKSPEAVESEGLYGFAIDVLSDLLPSTAMAKFRARFDAEPEWFSLMKPADYSIPTALTLLILGPVPGGDDSAGENPAIDPAVQEEIEKDDSDLWNDGEEPEGEDEE